MDNMNYVIQNNSMLDPKYNFKYTCFDVILMILQTETQWVGLSALLQIFVLIYIPI